MLSTILIVVLILLLIGALPTWPYSSGWGYYPGGGLGLVLIIVLILALSGRIERWSLLRRHCEERSDEAIQIEWIVRCVQ